MKHRIVHTLQKYLLNPPIKLALLILSSTLAMTPSESPTPGETLLITENAYNPIPSPDGKYIAYVRTGWGRRQGSGGRSRL